MFQICLAAVHLYTNVSLYSIKYSNRAIQCTITITIQDKIYYKTCNAINFIGQLGSRSRGTRDIEIYVQIMHHSNNSKILHKFENQTVSIYINVFNQFLLFCIDT